MERARRTDRKQQYDTGRVIHMETAREARRKNRRSTKALRRKAIYGIVFLALVTMIGVSVFNLISLKLAQNRAEQELRSLQKDRDKLAEILSYVDSKEYVEQQARRELMMIYPEETLYILTKEKEDGNAD